MSQRNNTSYYTNPEEALEQGDIFQTDLVAPAADEVQRIFSTKDGQHGSVVFEENCDGMVFSRAELDNLLESVPRTLYHTEPFHKTQDGYEEMVVVFSRLFRYFVIATQTCDISGIDKEAFEWATVLPVITLADLCRTEPLVFASTHRTLTIDEFVKMYFEEAQDLDNVSIMDYAPTLRQIVEKCADSVHDKRIRKDAKFLKSYLTKYYKTFYMFLLPTDSNTALALPRNSARSILEWPYPNK
jgi:hypothetical protein